MFHMSAFTTIQEEPRRAFVDAIGAHDDSESYLVQSSGPIHDHDFQTSDAIEDIGEGSLEGRHLVGQSLDDTALLAPFSPPTSAPEAQIPRLSCKWTNPRKRTLIGIAISIGHDLLNGMQIKDWEQKLKKGWFEATKEEHKSLIRCLHKMLLNRKLERRASGIRDKEAISNEVDKLFDAFLDNYWEKRITKASRRRCSRPVNASQLAQTIGCHGRVQEQQQGRLAGMEGELQKMKEVQYRQHMEIEGLKWRVNCCVSLMSEDQEHAKMPSQ